MPTVAEKQQTRAMMDEMLAQEPDPLAAAQEFLARRKPPAASASEEPDPFAAAQEYLRNRKPVTPPAAAPGPAVGISRPSTGGPPVLPPVATGPSVPGVTPPRSTPIIGGAAAQAPAAATSVLLPQPAPAAAVPFLEPIFGKPTKESFDQRRKALDRDKATLDRLQAEVKKGNELVRRGELTPERKTAFQAKIDRYKASLPVYKTSVEALNRDVGTFNKEIQAQNKYQRAIQTATKNVAPMAYPKSPAEMAFYQAQEEARRIPAWMRAPGREVGAPVQEIQG